MQVDETNDVIKDAHLLTYVCEILTDVRKDIIICKTIECNTTASEVFEIMDDFFIENERTVFHYAQMDLHRWQETMMVYWL